MSDSGHTMRTRQGGATLLIALVFLVILTLFAISGMNTGVINLRTANNSMSILESQFAAQQEIESVLNSSDNFFPTPIAAETGKDVDVNGFYTVKVDRSSPVCLFIRAAPGYSYAFAASAPKDTVWEVVASAKDNTFGTTVSVRQGVKIRLPVNATCPNP